LELDPRKDDLMKKARTEKKGIPQVFGGNARPGVAEALRPNAGISEKGSESKQTASGSDADVGSLIPAVSYEQIAERAKAVWVRRGRVAGQDQANWYEAEAQLRADTMTAYEKIRPLTWDAAARKCLDVYREVLSRDEQGSDNRRSLETRFVE
jgi:hypothetical protein